MMEGGGKATKRTAVGEDYMGSAEGEKSVTVIRLCHPSPALGCACRDGMHPPCG